MPRGLTGAVLSPRYKLLATPAFRPAQGAAAPAQVAWVPGRLDPWGNNQYGDCVSAEEAFAKATHSPEIFIDSSVVVAWAQRHGVLNGATLTEVLDAMQRDGFRVGDQTYDDGPYLGVDYSNEGVLQSAISHGPVKIAIASSSLPHGAGNQQGWYAVGGGANHNTDHCVSLCGHGPTAWLYGQLGVALPPGLPQSGYLLYTWATIGFVDHAWLMATCAEAWVRHPTTVGVPPLPDPVPPPTPTPDPVPPPTPTPTPTPDPVPPPPAPAQYPTGAQWDAECTRLLVKYAHRPVYARAIQVAQAAGDADLAVHAGKGKLTLAEVLALIAKYGPDVIELLKDLTG